MNTDSPLLVSHNCADSPSTSTLSILLTADECMDFPVKVIIMVVFLQYSSRENQDAIEIKTTLID